MDRRRVPPCALRGSALALVALSIFSVAGTAIGDSGSAPSPMSRQDLEVVDCLLPGQVRQLGGSTYVTQRRPIRATASECRIRGGEYVAFDRADAKTALKVWLGAAEAGDAEAQNNVGEIYEKGLGASPNYEAAVIWYQKAADQGNSRALFNLGTLYEQGLGVDVDKLKALNLYRQAWGLPADSVMYSSAAQAEQQQLRDELDRLVTEKDQQLKALRDQIDSLEAKLKDSQHAAAQTRTVVVKEADPAAQAQISTLKSLVDQLQKDRDAKSRQLAAMPQLRTPGSAGAKTADAAKSTIVATDPRAFDGLKFGRYFALVIGDQNYQAMESLATPLSDADRVAAVLSGKYGFSVRLLKDADDVAIVNAINELNKVLTSDDNLLIYYAGHGVRLSGGQRDYGYWLPVNASKPPTTTFWISNEEVTDQLDVSKAGRVLVVADSCYSGLLSSDPSYLFLNGGQGYSRDYIALKLPKRSRLLIASGGDQPVLDSGGGSNSVFAKAFVEELQANNALMPAQELVGRLSKRVVAEAAKSKFEEKPVLKSIKGAGHAMGDFFFVPNH